MADSTSDDSRPARAHEAVPDATESTDSSVQPPIRAWLAGVGGVPGWLWPPGVVIVTGWLGSLYGAAVVAYWLGAVAGCLAYMLVRIALEPLHYAQRSGAAIGVLCGLAVTALLLATIGQSILNGL